ncbi:hypothetical protein NE865_01748 [Phthorimaea operculella]|nr:hypothetical protein NE865_01748 [Phthorimaea operculella]
MNLSKEQFEMLLTKIGTSRASSTFAQCTAKYSGARKSSEVESFLAAVKVFKTLEGITDADAITGLPLVLTGDASIWKLRYEIYQECIEEKQDAYTSTEMFIAKKRALLASIPAPEPDEGPEAKEIDMVFGQLRFEIRERIPRDSIKTFDQLLDKAREIEKNLVERKDVPAIQTAKANPGKTKRCGYCRLVGHTTEVCRKKAKAEKEGQMSTEKTERKEETKTDTNKPKFSCYGCGEPGVIRSRCQKCKTRQSTPVDEVSFCMVKTTEVTLRPTVRIQIGHFKGVAHIDSGARSNVASYLLYKQLEKNGYRFESKEMKVTLADGITNQQTVLVVKAPVTLFNRVVPTSFLILPQARNNSTLLGVEFIIDALMVINIPQLTCRFLDEPTVAYELEEEDVHEDIFKKLEAEFEMPTMLSPVAKTPEKKAPTRRPVYKENGSGPKPASLPPRASTSTQVEETAAAANASTPVKNNYGPLIPIDLGTPPTKRPRLMFDGHSPVLDSLYYDAQENLDSYEDELKSCLSPRSAALFESPTKTDIASLGTQLSSSEHMQLDDLLNRNEDVFTSNETQENCDVCSIIADMPKRSAKEIRTEQMKDQDIAKIINALEDHTVEENVQYWNKKGYIMNNGLLYRYNPDLDTEDCQIHLHQTSRWACTTHQLFDPSETLKRHHCPHLQRQSASVVGQRRPRLSLMRLPPVPPPEQHPRQLSCLTRRDVFGARGGDCNTANQLLCLATGGRHVESSSAHRLRHRVPVAGRRERI